MSQRLFDELPEMSLLNFLHVEEPNELNMHFLFRMNQLVQCSTNQQPIPEMVLKLAKTRHNRKLNRKIKSKSVSIRKNVIGEYRLTIDSVEKLVESLTEHIYRLENF